MKIRNLTITALIISFFIIITSIYVNFDLVVNVRFYVDKNNELVESLKENKLRLETPIQQLKDINEYSRTTVSIAIIRDDIMDIIDSMQSDSLDLKNNLVTMNDVSLNRHNSSIQLISSKLLKLQINLDEVQFLLNQNMVLSEMLDTSQESRNEIDELILSIENDYDTLNRVILNDLSIVLNTIFILLLVVVSVLFFGLIRFVYFQIPYIVKGLTMLGDKQYNDEGLKIPTPYFVEEKNIHNYIENVFEENRFIEDVKEVLLKVYVVEDAVDALFNLLKERMGIDRVGLAFIDYSREMIIAEYSVITDNNIKLGPGFEVPFVRTSLYDLIESKIPMINNNLEYEFEKRPKSSSLYLLSQEGIKSNLILPLTMGNTAFGFLFLSSREKDFFTINDLHLSEKIVYEIKGLLNRTYFTKVVFSKITSGFSELVEKKDNETGEHISRMVKYSTLLANKVIEKNHPDYQILERTVLEIERNAAVHDIGKVGIPDSILKKPGKLNEEEWEIMRTHPNIGGDIFKSIRDGLKAFDPELYKVSEDITRYHHEKWNGEGYPEGLKGHDIPLVARIVSVADVFDAISSKRIYKDAFDVNESFEMLKQMSGKNLDPFLVDVFIESSDEVLKIYNKYK
jgi:HD-GYP domain-containing protein (c-di-GMP phosphodiesterase class II)